MEIREDRVFSDQKGGWLTWAGARKQRPSGRPVNRREGSGWGLTRGIPALRWLEEGDVYESEVHLNYIPDQSKPNQPTNQPITHLPTHPEEIKQ